MVKLFFLSFPLSSCFFLLTNFRWKLKSCGDKQIDVDIEYILYAHNKYKTNARVLKKVYSVIIALFIVQNQFMTYSWNGLLHYLLRNVLQSLSLCANAANLMRFCGAACFLDCVQFGSSKIMKEVYC